MLPVGVANSSVHLLAYLLTWKLFYLVSFFLATAVLIWTKFVMLEDINLLRTSKKQEVVEFAAKFTKAHHVRTVFSALAFILTSSALLAQ